MIGGDTGFIKGIKGMFGAPAAGAQNMAAPGVIPNRGF
jgi:hypothetical protein